LEIKYSGLNALARFLENCRNTFAAIKHKHTKSDITDFPTIPTKLSELTNDSGFVTTDTTYSAGNGLSLSGTAFSVTYGTSASALGTSSAGTATSVSRSDHVHALPALTSCTGTLTVAKGGTGATTAAAARTNLVVYSKTEVDNLIDALAARVTALEGCHVEITATEVAELF